MKKITLKEFQTLASLSDRALVYMLHEQLLPCSLDNAKGIMVDIDSVDVKETIKAIATCTTQAIDRRERLLAERLGTIVGEHLDEIIDQGIQTVVNSR